MRKTYNQQFGTALQLLNPAQLKAVNQVEGPVLVIAGPGTGKTHILAARIGKILLDTDTQPNNILCLTFTDAGVIALRERLLQLIGPEAHRVHVNTFHSFCNTIIQENLELFGKQYLEPMSELDRIDLIRKLLEELPLSNPLRQGKTDPYFFEHHLHQLFQTMKREDWTVDYVYQQIDDYLEQLPEHPDFIYRRRTGKFPKGAPKEAKIKNIQNRMLQLRAAATLYPRYEKEKEIARRYDYEDMILWVLRAFETHEFLLRNYQEQYLYLLVDEYQDTNGSQNELILKLASFWEVPNLFIVGDDDQSIYEFQGARLRNLLQLYQRYEGDMELIILEQNYRSSQKILDTALHLIDNNELRILKKIAGASAQKQLRASHPEVMHWSQAPQIMEFPSRRQELAGILERIQHLHASGTNWSEIAVIYAQHQQAQPLIQLLQSHNIPYQTRRRIDLLQAPFPNKLLKLLQYFLLEIRQAFSGEYLLFEILHFDFLQIRPYSLAAISLHLAGIDWLARPKWRAFIQDQQALERLQLPDIEAILQFSRQLEKLIAESVNYSLPVFFERMINRLGISSFILTQENKLELIQELNTIFSFVHDESRRDPKLTIQGLLEVIKRMERNRLPLALDASLDVDEGVQLITAHSAKGLEFEEVFVFDCVKNFWEPRTRGHSFVFKLPETLTYSTEADAMEARRRLFYVASTRAKKGLYYTYSRMDDNGKLLERALFIDELQPFPEVEFSKPVIAKDTLAALQVSLLTNPASLKIPPAPEGRIQKLLENFRLSVSALNNYLRCPLSFYYQFVLQAPSLMSEAAAYGLAVHNSLQRLFERMLRSKPRNFPAERQFLEFFSNEMERLRLYFSPDNFEHYQKRGQFNLKRYYQQHLGAWHRRVVVEYTIRTAEVEGVPLTGTIDKIEFFPQQEVCIVDYKTGTHRPENLRSPSDKNPLGGSYWRQLVFYKLLYENFDQIGRIAKSGAIAYLDPNSEGYFQTQTIDFEPGDTKLLKQLIVETYQKIKAHDFYTGCNLPNCKWCTFVNDNRIPDSFSDPELEKLDDKH